MSKGMFVTVTVAFSFMVQMSAAQQKMPRLPQGNVEWSQVRQAYDEGGIPAAAAVFGRYTATEAFGGGIAVPADLVALVGSSHLIVVGTALSGTAALSADRRHINTEWVLRVDEPLKGSDVIGRGRTVLVNVPGGELHFSNGTSARTEAPAGPPLHRGRAYILFLQLLDRPDAAASRGRPGTFIPAYGVDGVFPIVETSRVVALGDPNLPAAKELLEGSGLESAVKRVRDAVLVAQAHPSDKRLTQLPD